MYAGEAGLVQRKMQTFSFATFDQRRFCEKQFTTLRNDSGNDFETAEFHLNSIEKESDLCRSAMGRLAIRSWIRFAASLNGTRGLVERSADAG